MKTPNSIVSIFKGIRRVLEKIDRLAEESVYDIGGSNSWSGTYPLNQKLENFIIENIEKGKIRLACHD